MIKIKQKHSIIEQYSAFLKGYDEKGRHRTKNPYEKDSELYYFYSIGRKHKGEVDVGASKRRSYGYSEH